MRTVRLVRAGVLVLATLGAVAVSTVAQPELITPVTGERLGVEAPSDAGPVEADGYTRHPELVATFSWSDPRLLTTMRTAMTSIADHIFAAEVLLEGPDGTRRGEWRGFIDGEQGVNGILWLTGDAAYDGLVAVLHGNDDRCRGCMDYDGIIVAGALPPLPDRPEPAAE